MPLIEINIFFHNFNNKKIKNKCKNIWKKKFGEQWVSPPRGVLWVTLNETQLIIVFNL